MNVVHMSDIRIARIFSYENKDKMFFTIGACDRTHVDAIWDKNDKPAIRVRIYDNSASLSLEKEVHLGDYVVFNAKETKVLDILTPEQFHYSYIILEE